MLYHGSVRWGFTQCSTARGVIHWDRVSRWILKWANQNRCWADETQVRMSSIRGIPRTAAHLFACFVFIHLLRSAILKDGCLIEGLLSLSLNGISTQWSTFVLFTGNETEARGGRARVTWQTWGGHRSTRKPWYQHEETQCWNTTGLYNQKIMGLQCLCVRWRNLKECLTIDLKIYKTFLYLTSYETLQ